MRATKRKCFRSPQKTTEGAAKKSREDNYRDGFKEKYWENASTPSEMKRHISEPGIVCLNALMVRADFWEKHKQSLKGRGSNSNEWFSY
jgi:hypothetical protein